MTVVELWVAMGTPAIRDNVYDRTWIDFILKADHQCDLLIVPDVRFPNEAKIFQEEGAHLVKCIRPGYGPRDTVADQALVGFDGWDLIAGPTMEALHDTARHIFEWALGEGEFPTQWPEERQRLLLLEAGVQC